MDNEAHVICCNDAVEFVVVGTKERAKEKLEVLAKEYFDKTGGVANWRSERMIPPSEGDDVVYNYYKSRCYWHIHTVELEEDHG